MDEDLLKKYWAVVKTELETFKPGPNEDCNYYPCHFKGQDCAYCYCPFYPCMDQRLGKMVHKEGDDEEVWSCQDCYWTHRSDVAKLISENFPFSEEPPADEIRAEIKKKIEEKCPVSAKPLMILGTTSGAGKSIIASAFCRVFSDMGYNVAPFKSQNMSLNSMAISDGEIARAQYLQAIAARTDPEVSMNPILLKPQGDDVSQVVVNGSVYKNMPVSEYYENFTVNEGINIVTNAWEYLRRTRDIVVIEGAGSPAEINLSECELSNMKAAEIANAPCILVVNMMRGGAFAYAYGTITLLSPAHRKHIKGIIFNNMYGSADCLDSGIKKLESMLGIPVLGVIPHIEHALPEEDSQDLKSSKDGNDIAIVHLPRISNFTDFDALSLSGVSVKFVRQPNELRTARAIVIPGTKNTFADMAWMKENGFFETLKELRGKVPILGICGGYQILGKSIYDTEGIEGDVKAAEGLGFLDVSTVFDTTDKKTVQVCGYLENGEEIRGYEIHMGKTESHEKPLITLDDGSPEGSISPDGMVIGTYLHGIFDLPPFRDYFLEKSSITSSEEVDYDAEVDKDLDLMSETLRSNIDMKVIMKIMEDGV